MVVTEHFKLTACVDQHKHRRMAIKATIAKDLGIHKVLIVTG